MNLNKLDAATVQPGNDGVSVINSALQSIENGYDNFLAMRAGAALSLGDVVGIDYDTLTGTNISISAGSLTITGTSTSFLSEIQEDDVLRIGGYFFPIQEVVSDTSLVAKVYNGSGGTLSQNPSSVATRAKFSKASRDDDAFASVPAVGLMTAGFSSGVISRAKTFGRLEGLSSLTAGETYVLDEGTSGAMVRASQETLPNFYQVLGYALDTTSFFISIKAPSFRIPSHETLSYSATTDLDFNTGVMKTEALTGDVTFTTSNRAIGKSLVVHLSCDATPRNFTFPSWVFVGAAAPSGIAANKSAILQLWCYGSNDTDIYALYNEEP